MSDTATFLDSVARLAAFTSEDTGRDEARVAYALQGDRRKELLGALEDILIPFAINGVARDLDRLRKSRVLYADESNGPPARATVFPAGGGGLDVLPAGMKVLPVSPFIAYNRYFDWYIDKKENGESGVDAFFKRYPLLGHAVETVTSHYQQNILLACKRVLRDWDDIKQAFFPGRSMESLVKIKTTGNDFHKGGKQVLILTFRLDGDGEGRVVYKPSAVEIDCRIVGDSSVFATVQPRGSSNETAYTQRESLTEIINRLQRTTLLRRGVTSQPLPTYRILPYNRAVVSDAYGYIEFLSHEPAVPVTALTEDALLTAAGDALAKWYASAPVVSVRDWVTSNPDDALVFYHQFGAVCAMALAISLCDLHNQNVIVHKRAPHLIDLEEALKRPMTKLEDTYLISDNGPLNHYYDPGSPVLNIAHDETPELSVNRTSIYEVATSALWVFDRSGGPARPAMLWPAGAPDAVANRRALVQGFDDVTTTIATHGNAAVKQWVSDASQAIARYVTVGTAKYARQLRDLYQFYGDTAFVSTAAEDDPPRAADAWYGGVKMTSEPMFFFTSQVTSRWTDWSNPPKGSDPQWRPPFFALEHPDHVWCDYLNCDVPSFYHRLDSDDLQNARGQSVDVNQAFGWQAGHIVTQATQPAGWQLRGRPGAYLPRCATDVVTDQLERLRATWLDPAAKRMWLEQALSMTKLDAAGRHLASALPPSGSQPVAQ